MQYFLLHYAYSKPFLAGSDKLLAPRLRPNEKGYVYNDRAPSYYTQFEHGAIACDAYDKAVDPTGLSAGRTMVVATVNLDTQGAATNPAWVPDMPTKFFQLWLQEAKAAASNQLRQEPSQRYEREARRTYIQLLALDEQIVDAREDKGVNYGRPHRY